MLKLADECGLYLAEKSCIDRRVWVLDGDLADSDGAEQFSREVPERFIQAGIAEQCMVSTAAGMAACGARPWVFSFASFLCFRAYDQIRVGLSQTGLPVTLVGSHAGGCGGRNGKTHLALNDIAVMASLPNIEIWSPADRGDTRLAVDSVLAHSRPAYLRLPRTQVPVLPWPSSTARWIGPKQKITLVTHGLATHWALEVQQILAQRGFHIGILQVCKIWPLDHIMTANYIGHIEWAVVIEDHSLLGGLASLLRTTGFTGKLDSFGWPVSWLGQSGSDDALRKCCELTAEQIAGRITQVM